MPEWTWDPDDFAALWYSDAYDRFPRPLRYISRFAFNDDLLAHEAAVRAQYSREEHAAIRVTLDTLGQSELRIEILGGTSAHIRSTGPDDIRTYRIIGARTDIHAVTLSQAGNADDHGAIRVRLCRPDQLPTRLLAELPACAPGTHPPVTFDPGDITSRPEQFEDPHRTRARKLYRRILNRPADGTGAAVLRIGHYDTPAQTLRTLHWHDITGDGRYLEHRGTTITVRPATAQDLTRTFTTWLDHAWRNIEAERTVL